MKFFFLVVVISLVSTAASDYDINDYFENYFKEEKVTQPPNIYVQSPQERKKDLNLHLDLIKIIWDKVNSSISFTESIKNIGKYDAKLKLRIDNRIVNLIERYVSGSNDVADEINQYILYHLSLIETNASFIEKQPAKQKIFISLPTIILILSVIFILIYVTHYKWALVFLIISIGIFQMIVSTYHEAMDNLRYKIDNMPSFCIDLMKGNKPKQDPSWTNLYYFLPFTRGDKNEDCQEAINAFHIYHSKSGVLYHINILIILSKLLTDIINSFGSIGAAISNFYNHLDRQNVPYYFIFLIFFLVLFIMYKIIGYFIIISFDYYYDERNDEVEEESEAILNVPIEPIQSNTDLEAID